MAQTHSGRSLQYVATATLPVATCDLSATPADLYTALMYL